MTDTIIVAVLAGLILSCVVIVAGLLLRGPDR